MPKLIKPIQDNALRDSDILRKEEVYLSAETYSALVRLAKLKLESESIATPSPEGLTKRKAMETALFWVKSGKADKKVIERLRNKALFSSREATHEACLEAFLQAHPALKVRQEGEMGRPKGFVPPSKQLKIAIGAVVSDLINGSPATIKQLRLVK